MVEDASNSQKTALYSSEDPNKDQVNLDDKGFDLKIEQKKTTNSIDATEEGNVVSSIMNQVTTADQAEEDRILDDLEMMSTDFTDKVPIAPVSEKASRLSKIVLLIAILISLIGLAYIYSSRNGVPILGLSALTPLSETEEQLSEVRSVRIAQDYKLSALYLREIGYQTSQFAVEYQNIIQGQDLRTSQRNLNAARARLIELINSLKLELQQAEVEFANNFQAEDNLTLYLSDLRDSFENPQDKQLIVESLNLLNDRQPTRELLNKFNAEEMTDQDFLNYLVELLYLNKYSQMATIGYVQAVRISWSEIIAEIESATRRVDKSFSLDNMADESSITYTAFTFNLGDNRVNVTGQTKTPDDRTFTLIANLTDALEESDKFINVDTRTFSKQEDPEEGYRSAIRLNFNLEAKQQEKQDE